MRRISRDKLRAIVRRSHVRQITLDPWATPRPGGLWQCERDGHVVEDGACNICGEEGVDGEQT